MYFTDNVACKIMELPKLNEYMILDRKRMQSWEYAGAEKI